MMERFAEASPLFKARVAGAFYVLCILLGISAEMFLSGSLRSAANLIGTAFYVGVTLILYDLFKPVNKRLSLLAAVFSLAGCAVTLLDLLHLRSPYISSLEFFGVYCLLIAYLILRSTFMPRIIGMLLALAGLGWLTFLSPALGRQLFGYTMVTGLIGEGSLMLWLLVMGVNVQRWNQQAGTARANAAS